MIPNRQPIPTKPIGLTITDLDDDCLWCIMTFIEPHELPIFASFKRWRETAIRRFPIRLAFMSLGKWRSWMESRFGPNVTSLTIDYDTTRRYEPNRDRTRLIGFGRDFGTTLRFASAFSDNTLRTVNRFLPDRFFTRYPFFEYILRSGTMTTLSISGLECEASQIEGICQITSLRSLTINSCCGKVLDMSIFGIHYKIESHMKTKPIRKLKNLTELRLVNSSLSHKTIKDISKLTQLKILSLAGVRIGEMKRQVLPLLSNLTELVELDLSGTGLWKCIQSWPDQFSNLKKLTTLFISGNAIRPGQLNKIARIPNLRRLVMDRCTAPLSELVEVVHLNDLDLSGCSNLEYEKREKYLMDDEMVTKISDMKRIKRLIIANSNTTSVPCKELIKMVDLTELDLSGTQIDNECMEYLCTINSLKILRMPRENISVLGFSKIKQLTNLVTLDLTYTVTTEEIDEDDYIGDSEIVQIYKCSSITELNLPYNRITHKGLKFISRMPNLLKLDISGNAIPNEHIHIIASMKRIEELSITLDMSDPLIINSILEMESLTQVELHDGISRMLDWEPQWNNRMRKIKLITYRFRSVWLLRYYGGGQPRFVLVDHNGELGASMIHELEVIKGDVFILKDN